MAKETLSSKAKGNQEMAGAECARDEAMIENVMYLTDHQFNEIRIMAGKINVMGEFLRWTNPLDFYTGLEKWDINNLQALAACNGNVGSRGVRGRFTKNRPYTPPKKRNEATFSAPQLLISVNCIDGLAFNYELIFDNIFGKVQA